MVTLESKKEVEKKADYWGYHLILDCKACSIPKITSKENVVKFVKHLVEAIDMKAFGEPIVEHFATHDPEKGGFSLVQLIETSAITGHFVDQNGDVYLDIFSCKDFSVEICKQVVAEYFVPKKIKVMFLTRQA